MRLTAKSEYGLLAMIDLACRVDQGPVSAREISDRQSIPAKYLEQLFVALRKAGLVGAVRGAHGGFALQRPASEITVLDVVEALEGSLRPTVCDGDRAAACGRGDACAAAGVWDRATNAVREVLESTTLASLARAQEVFDESGATQRRGER
ncbi:MAG: RrF2 family transcriptional regulator [Coriobacteriia bacterium]|nr:RrF2 family transcriptional regulator [Coriobacteriia bacterium]